MITSLADTVTLNNGTKIPGMGLGVFQIPDEGRQRQTGLNREDLFVTSKVWNAHISYDETIQAFNDSLERLGLDYLDLYLIHWPEIILTKNHGKL